MNPETPGIDTARRDERDKRRRKEALEVLLEARERLLRQMAEEILAHRDVILEGASQESLFGFELQEIEDRYSARLNALNALLDNLEYRHPRVEHRVETLTTTVATLAEEMSEFLKDFEDWDLVGIDIVRVEGNKVIVAVALTSEVYPD
jgi:response regulator RpfG family c-di-GMP phosphodiesterase